MDSLSAKELKEAPGESTESYLVEFVADRQPGPANVITFRL